MSLSQTVPTKFKAHNSIGCLQNVVAVSLHWNEEAPVSALPKGPRCIKKWFGNVAVEELERPAQSPDPLHNFSDKLER